MVNKSAISSAVNLLGQDHARVILLNANQQDAMEAKWLRRAKDLKKRVTEEIVKSIEDGRGPSLDDDVILEFLMEHYIAVTWSAVKSTRSEGSVIKLSRVPRTLKEIIRIYDRWRKKRKTTAKVRKQAQEIKKEYLKKVNQAWRRYSDDFRRGNVATQENVLRKIKSAADVASSRAATIVRTETTNYYNDARKAVYDQADGVTHYLFMAIRDQRTTKWCADRHVDGKRGRHGLVYAKGDPITAQETPACHWNCRSEMIPLSPFNARHRKLIENLTLHRRNNVCHPLPAGWGNVA